MNFTKPYIIAEIGSNWKNYSHCTNQISLAKLAGADAVKFQLYTHKEIYGYFGDMPGEMPREWIPNLKKFADSTGIDFMCTAFSVEGYNFIDEFVSMHKIASCENNHEEIYATVSGFNKPFIRSNGANDGFIKFGSCKEIIMECVVDYPASAHDYSFGYLASGRETWGLSDHTLGHNLALVAVGAGCRIFEKHFNGLGVEFTPDAPHSASMESFGQYVNKINFAYQIMNQPKIVRDVEKDIVRFSKRRWIEEYQGYFRSKPS